MDPDSNGRRNLLPHGKINKLISNTHAHMPVQSNVHMHITTTQVCYNNKSTSDRSNTTSPPSLSYPIVNKSNGWAADNLSMNSVALSHLGHQEVRHLMSIYHFVTVMLQQLADL